MSASTGAFGGYKKMKCKVCNHELIRGTQKCPYCGALVPPVAKTSSDEFKWNVQDYPKPKKNQDVSIDWQSGRILDKDSGMIYDQSLNGWTEPDEIRDLFSFDTKNEKMQLALDKEMDKLSGNTATERRRKIRSDNMFHLPASMDFRMSDELSALLNDSDAEEKVPEEKAKHPADQTDRQTQTSSAVSSEASADRENIPAPSAPTFDFHRLSDTMKSDKTSDAPSKKNVSYAESMRSLHNAFSEVFGESTDRKKKTSSKDSFENDISRLEDSADHKYSKTAEIPYEKNTSSPAKESPAREASEAASENDSSAVPKADEKENSTNVQQDAAPDEKQSSDVEFLGFSRLIEAEKRFKEDMEKVTFLSPSEYEEAERAETQSQKLRFVPTISFRTIEDEYESYKRENNIPRAPRNEDKKVQIKINEPSGTKVTVQTQEISLASLEHSEKIKTKEVCLDAVKQPPKNVQVSVEVNAAQGNASVEVTRRHDGATVVKTMDKPDSGHLYVDGKDLTDYPDFDIAKNTDRQKTAPSGAASPDVKSASESVSENNAFLNPSDRSDAKEIKPSPDAAASVRRTAADNTSSDTNSRTSSNAAGVSRDLKPDDIADGSASSEAVQQTMQIPAAAAAALASAIAAKTETSSADAERGSSEMDPTFWEISDDISKMTITDIFGPDAHKIIEEGRKQSAANAAATAQKPDGSSPSAGTAPQEEKQSAANSTPTADPARTVDLTADLASDSSASGTSENASNASKADETASEDSLILDIRPEDIAASKAQTDSIQIPVVDPDRGTRSVTTDTISQERQAEMQEAFDAIDTLKEAESKKRAKEDKIAEKERLKAEKAVRKAEKARRKAQQKMEKEERKADDDDENSLGPVAKGLIIALAAVLIIEFAVIGIKLFAPDSGAAILIHRFESQITGIFSSDDSTSGDASDDGQQNTADQNDSSGS